MSTSSVQQFEADRRVQGFDEVIERPWAADAQVGTHSHPFDVSALMLQGELWLTVADQTRHLRAGDSFELARDVPHQERYGADGARVLVARRHASAAAPR